MTLTKLKKKLDKIEQALEKNRATVLIDGWQTQKFAKKSRKWDYYAQEKMKLIFIIEDIEKCERDLHNDDIFNHGICLNCDQPYKKD